MKVFVRGICFSLASMVLATVAHAQNDVCYIVVASEASAPALKANPAFPNNMTNWVVETSNGRLAAVIGGAYKNTAPAVLYNLKQTGRIAQDSFCMSPSKVLGITNYGSEGQNTPIAMLDVNKVPVASQLPQPASPRDEISAMKGADTVFNAQSDVQIKGLSWAMTPRQMIAEMERRGMTCKIHSEFPLGDDKKAECKGTNGGYVEISTYFKRFDITCEIIDSCGLDVRDVAQSVLDSLPVAEFRPQFFDTPIGLITDYCGFSSGGNEVCVMHNNEIRVSAGNPGGTGGISLQ